MDKKYTCESDLPSFTKMPKCSPKSVFEPFKCDIEDRLRDTKLSSFVGQRHLLFNKNGRKIIHEEIESHD